MPFIDEVDFSLIAASSQVDWRFHQKADVYSLRTCNTVGDTTRCTAVMVSARDLAMTGDTIGIDDEGLRPATIRFYALSTILRRTESNMTFLE